MYKYSLYTPEEERDLLAAPEGTLDVVPQPSALTGDKLNLDIVSEPVPASEALPAPAGETVGSHQEDAARAAAAANPKMFSHSFTEDRMKELYAQQAAAGQRLATEGENKADRLVSAAPDWYKGGPPPKTNNWGEAMNVLGGAITAAPAQRLKDPNRRADLKQRDAQRVALGGGLSTLFSHLFNKGQENYKTNQDAALKEAQMQRTLSGGKSGAKISYDAIKDQIDEAHRERAQDSLMQNRGFVQGQELAKHATDDPEVMFVRKQLEGLGLFSMAQTEGMTRETAYRMMPLLHTQQTARHEAGQAERDQINKERMIYIQADLNQRKKLDDEMFAEEQRRGQAYIPRVRWVNDTPPSDATVKAAREAYKDLTGMSARIHEVREIQRQYVALADKYAREHNVPGGVAEVLKFAGPVVAWGSVPGLPQEMKDLANKAIILQDAMKNYYRGEGYANLGVPQKWEELKASVISPLAGSPTAYLRGEEMWRAMEDNVNNMFREAMNAAGGYIEGEAPPSAAPGARTPEQRAATQRPINVPSAASYNPQSGEVVTGSPVTTPDSLGTTGQSRNQVPKPPGATPAPAPAPTPTPAAALKPGQKMYRLTTKDGNVSDKPMSEGAAAILAKDGTFQSVTPL